VTVCSHVPSKVLAANGGRYHSASPRDYLRIVSPESISALEPSNAVLTCFVSDRVLVMEAGCVVEYGERSACLLLSPRPDSHSGGNVRPALGVDSAGGFGVQKTLFGERARRVRATASFEFGSRILEQSNTFMYCRRRSLDIELAIIPITTFLSP
jgi:hypothetical protein